MEKLLFFIISICASTAGAICGVGGGVIIKPVLDLVSSSGASVISFLSSCTVLSMSLYSVVSGKVKKQESASVPMSDLLPLSIGAAVGGVAGKTLFSILTASLTDKAMVSSVQSAVLLVVTIGTLLYTLFSERIRTRNVKNTSVKVLIGLALGIMSSFLGIGGGPINLVVLYYFFSMDTKNAAFCSLFVILFSQIASLIMLIVTGSVPTVDPIVLAVMIVGGICGGIAGRAINTRIDNAAVKRLFIGMMIVIILICAFNSRALVL